MNNETEAEEVTGTRLTLFTANPGLSSLCSPPLGLFASVLPSPLLSVLLLLLLWCGSFPSLTSPVNNRNRREEGEENRKNTNKLNHKIKGVHLQPLLVTPPLTLWNTTNNL